MSKNVLYLIIFFLLGALSVLLFMSFSTGDKEKSSIVVTPAEIDAPAQNTKLKNTNVVDSPTTTEPEAPIVLSGSLVDVKEIPNTQGSIDIIVLVNDGTEVISGNANAIVEPGVLAPIDSLGLKVGQQVTLKGHLESGSFYISAIE